MSSLKISVSYFQSDQQHNDVLMLKQQTGLNYSFALQCLADNNWNMTNALESFERLKVRQT